MSESHPLLHGQASSASSRRGMRIVLKELEYTVPSNIERGKQAYLLKDVSAYFDPGQMSCLIGPSGSGKTTLMDILAGRKTQGTIKGDVLFANTRPTKAFLRRYTGYVEQFDTLLESLTVREMLLYTAELKRPLEETKAIKQGKVDLLLQKMSLDSNANNKTGKQGGVKKKVNIAIALITDPRVLFLDEPTTGLDSNTANTIMTVVKNLCQDGTTIVSTIHSPTPYTFSLFDRVLFLLTGNVAFFGDRAQAVPYLESCGETETQKYDNQAEWLTAVMVKAEREKRGPELAAKFAGSVLKQEADKKIELFLSAEEDDKQIQAELAVRHATVTPVWFAFKILLQYRTWKSLADPYFWINRFITYLLLYVLMSLLYYNLLDDLDRYNMTNTTGAVFIISGHPIFTAPMHCPALVAERSLLYRELDDGLYRPVIYLLNKMMCELFAGGLVSLPLTAMVFYAADMQGVWFWLWINYFAAQVTGISMAYTSASIMPDLATATALVQVLTLMSSMFGGFLILPDDIPIWLRWLYHINPVSYGFRAVMINHYEEHDNNVPEELSVLDYYDINRKDNMKAIFTGVNFAFAFGVIFLGYLAMISVRHQKR